MEHAQRLTPVELRGAFVELAPLAREHVDALWEAGRFPELWAITVARVRSRAEMESYVACTLAAAEQGSALPFVTRWRADGRVVGSTRFGNFEAAHARVEIGWTWVTPAFQRTVVNSEAKWLMLRHAFEVWKLNRVEFKTDAINARSQGAMERLGLVREGVLRRHSITAGGRVRDSVYFSAIREEWPQLDVHIRARIAERAARSSCGPLSP
jgi:RimJ/RimL family protein N-acetyltransferase